MIAIATLVSGLLLAAASPQPSPGAAAAACGTLADCLAVIRDPKRRVMHVDDRVDERITAFGAAAVDALVAMLMDPDIELRERAGFMLSRFRRIDPKHLPAIIHAWRHGDTINNRGRGNGWLPRPIAATGTDEALRLLWADFLRDPREGSNAQVLLGLASFGPRIQPLVRAQLQACAATWVERCDGIFELLFSLDGRFPPPVPAAMPQWATEEIVGLADAPGAEARGAAAYALARLHHPAGIPPLRRQLADFRPVAGDWQERMNLELVLNLVANYGAAAIAAGPEVAAFLAGADPLDARQTAALVVGQIGYAQGAGALIALEPLFRDDWLLAYNAAESLGRIRSLKARPLLERLRASHWHRGVRNNAARALNTLDGGGFALPRDPDDGPVSEPEEIVIHGPLFRGELRYAADDDSRWCLPEDSFDGEQARLFAQAPAAPPRWPRASQEVKPQGPGAAVAAALRRRYPALPPHWKIDAFVPWGDGALVAVAEAGDASGLHFVRRGGSDDLLFPGVVRFIFPLGSRLYVAGASRRLGYTLGELLVIEGKPPRVVRRTLLPRPAQRFGLARDRAVLLDFGRGAVAVTHQGQLVDPGTLPSCQSD